MPIQVPVTQTGLEASIEAAAKRAGKSLKINLGSSAKSIEGLSQPLGRITGKADQFTKSMEAANARVLAFGASVGVLSAVQRGFADLVRTTVEVQKSLASINSILGTTAQQLDKFKSTIFEVARNTEQSFDTVATAALELSRQGLKAEEVTKRLNDSLVLSRLSGLGAAEAVAGLTSAINSFNSTGITSAEVLNKLSAAAVSAAVSERDLIEGIKRSGAVAIQAGVSFDELVGVITAVQEKTARGGAVIGNSFKTIFTRIQSLDKLQTMQNLGVQVTDASGEVLSATKLIQNLGETLRTLPDARRLQIAENLVGKFQIAPFLAILEDFNDASSTAIRVTEVASKATTEAYSRNIALNKTLSAAINEATINLKELANTLGEIGVTDSLQNILGFFNTLVTNIKELLDGDGVGSEFAKGFVKAIGGVISGPGLAIFGAIIAKLTLDLAKFGVGSLKTFFGLNKAAKEQATLQGQIASTLLGNEGIQRQILAIENSTLSVEQKRAAQTKFFTTALNEQLAVMTRMQTIAARVTPGVFAGTRGLRGRGAGGFIPNYNAVMGYGSEQADINRGVGGAPKSARPVTIPNFNFGGGQRGTMVANNSEYIVPNFAGGGSAIFNQDMVASMGLPAGAKKVGAAGGYVPNFAKPVTTNIAGMIIPRKGIGSRRATGTFGNNTYSFPVFGIDAAGEKVREEEDIKRSVERFSIGLATRESRTMTGGDPTASKINRLANQGAIGGLAGAIFETALSSLLKSKDFDFGETATFDYVGQAAINNIGDISPALKGSAVKFLDAKIADNTGTRNSLAKKIFNYFGASATGSSIKTKGINELMKASGKTQDFVLGRLGMTRGKGASGYIPNFASPLEAAIGRESAAGLPINQIRINQDPSLRNAGNPMGLAVTNTRDEPTGAIPAARGFVPNYSRKGTKSIDNASKNIDDLGKASKEAAGGQRDLLGGIFAVQVGFSALSGATSGLESKLGRISNTASSTASSLTTAAFAGSAINSFGKSISGVGGKVVSKLGLIGATIGFGSAIIKGFSESVDIASGFADQNNIAMEKLAKSADRAALSLNKLGASERKEVVDEAEGIVARLQRDIQGNPALRAFGAGRGPEILRTKEQREDFKARRRAFLQENQIRNPDAMRNPLFDAEVVKSFDALGIGMRGKTADRLMELVTNSVAAGISEDTIRELVLSFAEGGTTSEVLNTGGQRRELLDMDEFNKLADAINKIREGSLSFADIFKNLDRSELKLTSEFGKLLDPTNRMEGRLDRLEEFEDDNPEFVKNIRKDFADRGIETTRAQNILLIEQAAKIDRQFLNEKEANLKRIEALELATAKIRIKNAIEQKAAELSLNTSLETRLEKAKILNNVSDEQLVKLERQKFEQELQNKIIEKRADALGKSLDEVKGLVTDQKQILDIEKEILALNAKDIQDKEVIAGIMAKVLGITDKENSEINILVKNFMEANNAAVDLQNTLNESDRKIRDMKDGASLLSIELKKAATGASIRATNQAFDANQELEREDVRDQALVTSLQQQLQTAPFGQRAALQDSIKGVQARIAQRGMARSRANLIDRAQQLRARMSEQAVKAGPFGAIDQGLRDFATVNMNREGVSFEEILSSLRTFAMTTKDGGEEFRKDINDLGNAMIADTEAAKASADAANQAALALNDFQQAVADARNQLEQSERMGLTSRAAADRRRLKAIEDNPKLTPANASELSDLQRGVGARIVESGEFDPVLQADRLAQTITDAAIAFKTNISDALVDAISRGEDLGDALRNAATGFFNALAKGYMEQAVNSIIGGGGGGPLGSILGFLNPVGANSGGPIRGGSGTRDDVPALLTGGEFVMRKSAVQKYGTGFMGALNTGSVPTMNRGGLFTPGSYGQGAMTGKRNLLDFATQAFTTGAFDSVAGGAGFASIALEPQSAALTMFGRRNSPQFAQEQASKRAAFGLFVQQSNKEKQQRERDKQASSGLLGSIMAAGAGFALSSLFSGGKKATGGAIPYAAGVDTVPAMLSGGEFVMNAAATQRIGRGNLSALNSGGGLGGNGAVIGKLDELISVSDNQGETVINITVNSDGTSSENGNGDEQQNNLATRIRDVVKQVIDDEKRLGGSLREVRA